jgi:hypothetical protein
MVREVIGYLVVDAGRHNFTRVVGPPITLTRFHGERVRERWVHVANGVTPVERRRVAGREG